MTECILQVNDLYKQYGRATALNGLTMAIPRGSIYGLIGENGAGKTTLMKIVCGLQRSTKGAYSLHCARMGALIESPSFYADMSAEENVRQQFRLLGLSDFERIPSILELVGLNNTGKKKAKRFSLGMRQRLGIAIAMAGDPDFLVLDEPMNGLDPQGMTELRTLLLRINQEKHISVLISSHLLTELSRIATQYGFLRAGRMIKEMNAAELEQSKRKRIAIEVSDMGKLIAVLNGLETPYRQIDEHKAEVFAKIQLASLSAALQEAGCELLSFGEQEESIEDFYFALLGEEDEQ